MTIVIGQTVGEIAAEMPNATREVRKAWNRLLLRRKPHSWRGLLAKPTSRLTKLLAQAGEKLPMAANTMPSPRIGRTATRRPDRTHHQHPSRLRSRRESAVSKRSPPRSSAYTARIIRNSSRCSDLRRTRRGVERSLDERRTDALPLHPAHGRERSRRRTGSSGDVRDGGEPGAHDDAGARRRRRSAPFAAFNHQRTTRFPKTHASAIALYTRRCKTFEADLHQHIHLGKQHSLPARHRHGSASE